ncbi:16S rRNA (cytosine(967)-C(5))-methyltransferase RsmB [Granulicatella sp. zg-84]|uniref:16S rRNA (cytosine(967)-C(5))-methyltransferase RsmB n=1 Tax=Granulicatella sp. zg-84 TaxID=2678503 RepID=UPI001F07FDE5|nr:16S rRNA (cytosine(967)-C(5))-methyltransferase RsmB [Granulicatella sp. zg-84]
MKNKSIELTKAQRKKTVRYLAMKILVDVEQNQAYVNLKLDAVLKEVPLSTIDANLLTEIVYGVTQRRLTLDYLLEPYVKKAIPLWLRTILRLSTFQMIFLDKIPAYAILNEASEITKIKAGQSIVNFVNGVLRNIDRNGKERLSHLMMQPRTKEVVSLRTSLPMWLVTYFDTLYGLEETEKIGYSLLEKPYLSVRAYDVDKAINQLSQTFMCEKSPLAPNGIRIHSGHVAQTSLFLQGDITIQDESSMLVALCGALEESDKVLDACAAPGGKTTHIAHFLNKEKGGIVYALDLYEHKIKLIEENAKRLHVDDVVEAMIKDARDVSSFSDNYFDKVFVDAPCSGLGLMRRKPDIKYSKVFDTISSLSAIQEDILESVFPKVAVGGRLIYSTCTVTLEENEKRMAQFLKTHTNFERVPLYDLKLPKECYTEYGEISILPHMFGTDGFYICCLKRIK